MPRGPAGISRPCPRTPAVGWPTRPGPPWTRWSTLSFNSSGACPTCQGTGVVRTVDDTALVPDASKTLDEGAVLPWQMLGFNVQPAIAREFGVRTDVPWSELIDAEREIVLDGPEEKKHIAVAGGRGSTSSTSPFAMPGSP